MITAEIVEPEIQQNGVQKQGTSMELFRAILQSLKEVQQGSFRTISGKTVNSIPLDMDIELSNCIVKMEKLIDQYQKSTIKIIQSYGLTLKPREDNPDVADIIPPEDKKDDAEYIAQYLSEINAPIDFDIHSELSTFTKERFLESKIDLADAPNRNIFFQEVLK